MLAEDRHSTFSDSFRGRRSHAPVTSRTIIPASGIDVRLGDTNGKEASPARALDSSATALAGFLPPPITCSILRRATLDWTFKRFIWRNYMDGPISLLLGNNRATSGISLGK